MVSDQLSKRYLNTGAAPVSPCASIQAQAAPREYPAIESAATPVEVELPPIDSDEAFQRDYIPLGRSGWEIQTKGKGSTYRLCEPGGHRLAIPDAPYLHETLTRMARDVHADYAILARQLAESERQNKIMREADYHAAGVAQEQEIIDLEEKLAAVTRRVAEVEEVLRQIDAYHGPIRTPIHTITKLRGMARAALQKEPGNGSSS